MKLHFINIHTHKITRDFSIAIYNKDLGESISDKSYFSVGIHPWSIPQDKLTEYYSLLKKDLKKENCLALGEIGLDKAIKTDFNLQKQVFIKQLEINKSYHKPVILHVVKSFQEVVQITKVYDFPFIIHGFNKKQQLAEQLLKKGFYLSFGVNLLKKEALQLVVKHTPINRLFLETDDAHIPIETLYKKVAEIKEINLESLILAIHNNFETIFQCKING